LILNPEKAVPSNEPDVQERESWEKIAKKILNSLWKVKGAYHFHSPVDPIKWNCPDYFDIVKHPMDFGTIKNNLNNNVYKRCQDFVEDMKMVTHNCILYNGAESEVGKIGTALAKEFDSLCHNYNLNIFLNPPHPQQQIQQQQNHMQQENEAPSQAPEISENNQIDPNQSQEGVIQDEDIQPTPSGPDGLESF